MLEHALVVATSQPLSPRGSQQAEHESRGSGNQSITGGVTPCATSLRTAQQTSKHHTVVIVPACHQPAAATGHCDNVRHWSRSQPLNPPVSSLWRRRAKLQVGERPLQLGEPLWLLLLALKLGLDDDVPAAHRGTIAPPKAQPNATATPCTTARFSAIQDSPKSRTNIGTCTEACKPDATTCTTWTCHEDGEQLRCLYTGSAHLQTRSQCRSRNRCQILQVIWHVTC
jgi:hypothetical protein